MNVNARRRFDFHHPLCFAMALRILAAASAAISALSAAAAAPYTVLQDTRCHNHIGSFSGVPDLATCEGLCNAPLVSFCGSSVGDCPESGGCWCYPLGQLPNCDSDKGWLSAYTSVPEPPPTPYDYASGGAFADNLCNLAFTDANATTWSFDLRSVAMANGTSSGYGLAPCGVVNLACAMLPVPAPFGAGVQLSGAGTCFFPLSVGPPLTALLDPANAATGGLVTTFGAAWTQLSNGATCNDWSPERGREEGRKLVLVHGCDPKAAPGAVTYLGVTEDPQCVYTALLSSSAACGVKVAAEAAAAAAQPVPNPPAPALPPWAPNAGPMAPYLCSPVLADSAGKRWAFSLQGLFLRGADYTSTTALGSFALNVCGNTAATCTPAYGVRANFGGLVVSWAGGAAPPAGTACTWANGTAAPCSAPCRTLGEGAPMWSLADAANGATGGLVMALQGELVSADEPAAYPRCGWDVNGDPLFPSVTAVIACDAAVATLKIDTVNASATDAACSYVVVARASAACGAAA